jgi:hypothetical protein
MIRLPEEELEHMSARRLKILRSQRVMLLSKTKDEQERAEIEAFIEELTQRINQFET